MTRKRLLPGFIRKRLPSLNAIAEIPLDQLTVQAKFFYPDFDWTWYAVAWDGEDLFWGMVDGFEAEYGYFSLRELLENRGKLGCTIERDRFFDPQPVTQIYERAAERRALTA